MTTQPHPHLLVETDGPVRTITLNHAARRNAQTPSLWVALGEQARSVPEDVRVVVIRGEGPAFSAGIDTDMFTPDGVDGEERIGALLGTGAEATAERIGVWQEGFTGWSRIPAIVIAEVQGHALGAGFQLALAADLRVVADDVKLAMRETSLGLVPDLAGTTPLVALVGYARALEICATGRNVGAEEAQRLGLANVVAPAAHLAEATTQLIEGLLAAPAAAVLAIKPLLRAAVGADVSTQARLERETQTGLLQQLLAGFPR